MCLTPTSQGQSGRSSLRLTPRECGRLQGFPDWWVDGANGSDSAIYRMWGNGIALPCAYDCVSRLADEMRRSEST